MQTVKGPDRTPEEEITRMVNEHQLALLRLCFTYLHDKDLAKDAVQETFLKAYRNLQDFRYDANEKTWLSRIAINCCRDISRSSWFRHTDSICDARYASPCSISARLYFQNLVFPRL